MVEVQKNRLRVLRAEHRMVQRQLANLARINVTRLSFIENSHVEATPDERARLAQAFNLEIAEIFPVVGSADSAPADDPPPAQERRQGERRAS